MMMVPTVVVAILRAKKPRMRINPNTNDNHRNNNKCHIFKTKHTRRASFYHNNNNNNNAKRVKVSIIIGRYLFFVLLIGILLGASWSSESLEHIRNALDTATTRNLFHESLR